MALTSRDETDLLLPLFGNTGAASFTTFLERLRRRAACAYAGLIIRGHGSSWQHEFSAGLDLRRLSSHADLGGLPLLSEACHTGMRIGRVYSPQEFDAHDPALAARNARAMRRLGVADGRVVRVLDEADASAWLTIASEGTGSASDSALLSNLVPYLAPSIRGFLHADRQAMAAALNADSLARAGTGWIAFDAGARVVDVASSTARFLQEVFGHELRHEQRLREFGPAIERELTDAAAHYAAEPMAAARAIVLLRAPPMEAILVGRTTGQHAATAMVARCRHPRLSSHVSAEHFARLHALPRREAELAILIANGLALDEASQALGLTLETTRNYSKRLFAKLGVRGQAGLVRAVYESGAMLG